MIITTDQSLINESHMCTGCSLALLSLWMAHAICLPACTRLWLLQLPRLFCSAEC